MPCTDDCSEGKGKLCCLECPEVESCTYKCDEVKEGTVTREEGPRFYKTMCASWQEAEGLIDLSVKEETFEALNLLRWKLGEGEDDDALIRRIVEYARCYMVIWGAEGSEEKPRLRPPLLEVVKDFVLSRRSDIEKDMEDFGALKPVLNYFLAEAES